MILFTLWLLGIVTKLTRTKKSDINVFEKLNYCHKIYYNVKLMTWKTGVAVQIFGWVLSLGGRARCWLVYFLQNMDPRGLSDNIFPRPQVIISACRIGSGAKVEIWSPATWGCDSEISGLCRQTASHESHKWKGTNTPWQPKSHSLPWSICWLANVECGIWNSSSCEIFGDVQEEPDASSHSTGCRACTQTENLWFLIKVVWQHILTNDSIYLANVTFCFEKASYYSLDGSLKDW